MAIYTPLAEGLNRRVSWMPNGKEGGGGVQLWLLAIALAAVIISALGGMASMAQFVIHSNDMGGVNQMQLQANTSEISLLQQQLNDKVAKLTQDMNDFKYSVSQDLATVKDTQQWHSAEIEKNSKQIADIQMTLSSVQATTERLNDSVTNLSQLIRGDSPGSKRR